MGGHAGTALTPAVEERIVYVGGKSLLALDLESGDEVWSATSNSLSPAQDGWGAPPSIPAAPSSPSTTAASTGSTRPGPGTERRVAGRHPSVPHTTGRPGQHLWIVEGGTSSGVSAFGNSPGSESDSELMWTYEPESEGDWHMAAADNRVFLLHEGSVVALPVF